MIVLKTPEQIAIMDEANKIVNRVLNLIEENIKPGVTTKQLDNLAEEAVKDFGASPAFKGYRGFPCALCVSINNEVVHGIPSEKRVVSDGDAVSIDFGAIHQGYCGDAARTILIGSVSEAVKELNNITKLALEAGITKMCSGNRINDISKAIEDLSKIKKYGNIKAFCGHGIGTTLHCEPKVLNYVDPSTQNIRLQEGMVLALEPMFTLGSSEVKVLADNWTVVTLDESIACHWEYSVAITKDGPKILGR